MKKRRVIYILLILLLYTNLVNAEKYTSEIINNIANEVLKVINNKIQITDNAKTRADLLSEKSEIYFLKLKLNPSAKTKEAYKKNIKYAIDLYKSIGYNPGVFINKTKLLKFQLEGNTEKYNITEKDLMNFKNFLSAKLIKYKKYSSLKSDMSKNIDTDIIKPVNKIDSSVLAISQNIKKNDSDTVKHKNQISDTTTNIKPIASSKLSPEKMLKNVDLSYKLMPEMVYLTKTGSSPILKQLETQNYLKKEYEIEEKKSLLGFEKTFGKTKLSISGKKTINVTMDSKKYKHPDENHSNTNNFKVDQTLEVKVRGQVGENVDVNIDYNDKRTSSQRQQLSIKYNSDKHVLSKDTNKNILSGNVAFGDLVLSLTGTEFVSYNRSLFGIKGGLLIENLDYSFLKADRLSFNLIASRTKGEPGHKEFKGQTSSQIINTVYDLNYVKNKYYQITTENGIDTYSIVPGSERIYLDDKIATNNQDDLSVDTKGIIVNPKDISKTYISDTYSFKLLSPGTDYTIDYKSGILKFRIGISDNYTIAVSYQTDYGYKIEKKIIKKDEDSIFSDTYTIYEIKNIYSFGISDISKDDPDFIFEIQDKNNNYSSGLDADSNGEIDKSFLEIFGLDKTGPGPDGVLGTSDDRPDGKIDDEFIDYSEGTIQFSETQPFDVPDLDVKGIPLTNGDIYKKKNPDSRYRFYLEVKAKSQQYFLNAFDLVRNSETVKVDGTIVTRNQDYYIDYETGLLLFLNPGLISKTSIITVDYEKTPFGASANKTMLGYRLETKFNNNFSIGSTSIYNTNDKAKEIPDIYATPQKTVVNDVNMEFKPVNLMVDLFNKATGKSVNQIPSDWFDIKVITETAKSNWNPNIYGKALLDDMESTKDEIGINLNYKSWYLTDMPLDFFNIRDKKGTVTFDETSTEENIGHKAELDKDETQQSTIIRYNFDTGDTWIAIRTLISKTGVDITKKNFLEFWAKGAENVNLNIDIGVITEDMDGDGVLDQEDGIIENGEQKGDYPDGILNKSPVEDIGVLYNPLGDTNSIRIGADNGQLDSEDMNQNGSLDKSERFYRYKNLNLLADTEAGKNIDVDRTDWTFYKINLYDFTKFVQSHIVSDADKPDLKAVKHIRIWFTKKNTDTGTIYLDYMSIVGNSWEDNNLNDTQFFYSGTMNNRDDNYTALTEELSMRNLDENYAVTEQALSITYNNIEDSNHTDISYPYLVKKEYGQTFSIARYKTLIFYVKSLGDNYYGETAFIRLGDNSNYFEYRFQVPKKIEDWKKIEIDLDNFKNKLIEITNSDSTPPYNFDFGDNKEFTIAASQKKPSLHSLNNIYIGVLGKLGGVTNKLLFNTIYVDGVITETGQANKASIQTTFYKNIFAFNTNYSTRENTFRKIGEISSSASQAFIPITDKTRRYDGTVKVGKLLPSKWNVSMPVSGSYQKTESEVEPDIVQDVERSKIGKTTAIDKKINITISKAGLPTIKGDYSKNDTDKDLTETKYKSEKKDLNTSASYSYKFKKKLFGEIFLIKKIPWLNKVGYGKDLSINLNYQYTFSEQQQKYSLGVNEPTYNKYKTYYKKIAIVHRPFSWIKIQPQLNLTDKYHTTLTYSGLEDKIVNTGINIDIKKFFGMKYVFDFTYNLEKKFDIAHTDSDPVKVLSSTYNIKLDLAPVDWWKKLKFSDYRFNFNTKYNETLNTKILPYKKAANISGSFSANANLRPNELWHYLNFFDIHYTYNNSVTCAYTDLDKDIGFKNVFNNYYNDYIWFWKSKERKELTSDTLTLNRTSASNNQSHTFNGQFYVWDPLNLRYTVNNKNQINQSQNSENYTKTFSAQLNSRLNLKTSIARWFATKPKAALNFNYTYTNTKTGNYLILNNSNSYSHNRDFSIELQWTKNFNTTFRMNFPESSKITSAESGNTKEKTNTLNPQISWSYMMENPFKVLKPLSKKQWLFKNKLNLSGTLFFNTTKTDFTDVENVTKSRTDTTEFGTSVNANYDLSDFIRANAGLSITSHSNKVIEGDDYMIYKINAGVVITF